MTPLIFVHIPKTAGTSFRVAAEEWFGKSHLLHDYGSQARRTSPIFRRYEAGKMSWEKLLVEIGKAKFVTGHFAAQRYLSAFSPSHFCAFVRDPVERTISQYFHHRHVLGYSHGLETFVEDARFHDQQHRLLAGLSLDQMGFVGVTEAYAESLSIFNSHFGTALKVGFHNQRASRQDDDAIPIELITRIRERNERDVDLHRSAVAIMTRRLADLAG